MIGIVLCLCAVVVPATTAQAATAVLTANPSSGLLDGQSIVVTGTGFPAKTKDVLAECQTGATNPIDSCYAGNAAPAKSDASGSFTLSYTAVRVIETGASGSPVDCATAGACILAVFDLSDLSLVAETPIAFADVVIVPPTVSAVPSTGLLDGQKIAVSGTHWTPGAQIALSECPAAEGSGCGFTSRGRLTADASGAFSSSFTASRFIDDGASPIDCAQPSACLLEAFNLQEPDQTASTPIAFADITVVPPTLSATPSTALVDGQDVSVTGKGFRPHDVVALSECKAGSSDFNGCTGENGIGNLVQIKADGSGRFTVPFNVARLVTLVNKTVDCAVAPGCVIGAVDEMSQYPVIDAVTPLAFNPAVPPLPPLNLNLTIDPTGHIVAGAKRGTAIEISGTIACDRTTAVPVGVELQVTQPGSGARRAAFVVGQANCQRHGATFSETVPAPVRHPAVPGTAAVLISISAVSGSDTQSITVSASVTLKGPTSS